MRISSVARISRYNGCFPDGEKHLKYDRFAGYAGMRQGKAEGERAWDELEGVRMQPRLMRVSCQRGRRSYSGGKGVVLSPTRGVPLLRQATLLGGRQLPTTLGKGRGEGREGGGCCGGDVGHVFPGSRLPTVAFLHAYIAMLA